MQSGIPGAMRYVPSELFTIFRDVGVHYGRSTTGPQEVVSVLFALHVLVGSWMIGDLSLAIVTGTESGHGVGI